MRSKQYFTSIKNNPHEISTDPLLLLPDKKSSSAFIGRLKKSWSSYNFERAVFLYKHHSINYYVSDQDMFTLAVPVY